MILNYLWILKINLQQIEHLIKVIIVYNQVM